MLRKSGSNIFALAGEGGLTTTNKSERRISFFINKENSAHISQIFDEPQVTNEQLELRIKN